MNARLFVLPVLVAISAFAYWKYGGTPEQTPACTWRTGTDTAVHQGANFDKLPPETPVRLSLHSPEPVHVYVFSLSAEDGTLLLYPSPKVQCDLKNPLQKGQSVLPGRIDGKDLAWTTRTGIQAATVFVAFASREPLAELDGLVPKVRQWSNTVFPDHSMQVTLPKEGADVLGKAHADWPAPLLQLAAVQLREQTEPNGAMTPLRDHPGVWISSWKALQTR